VLQTVYFTPQTLFFKEHLLPPGDLQVENVWKGFSKEKDLDATCR